MHKVKAIAIHDILYQDENGKDAFVKAGGQPSLPKTVFDALKAQGAVREVEIEPLPLFAEKADAPESPKPTKKTRRWR